MAVLLQISEPGQSPEPHQRKRAVGIDLGTTNSLVATVRSGSAVILNDEQGRALLPSALHYDRHGLSCVGYEALGHDLTDPLNTLTSVKRFMGRGLADVALFGEQLPYEFVEQPGGGMPKFATAAGAISPVQASAELLASLERRAELALGGDLDGAVITVPAYFDDAQRQATKDAAMLAGLKVLRLLNEPTAAAIAYGLDAGGEGTIAVYDLGGGTFDISILRLTRGVFEVLASGGDSALGGDDFDRAIADWLRAELAIDADMAPAQQRQLLAAAKLAKQQLSEVEQTQLTVGEQSLTLDRDQLAELLDPLIAKTLRACRRSLADAGVKLDDIDNVVLVGGSTRALRVREKVADYFGREPLCHLDPDQVVALGAAIQAEVLIGNKSGDDLLLLDVIPLSLGIETMGGLVEKIIHRNTTIPVAKAQEFTTFKDGQTALAVHVVQGERELVSDCRSLARFELRGIPPMTAGSAKIRVTYQVDADGLLSVAAREMTSGVEARIEVKPSYGLDDGEVTRMLQESFSHARDDMAARALAEQQVEADRIIEDIRAAIAADGEQLLDSVELDCLNKSLDELQVLRDSSQEHRALARKVESVAKGSEAFAARRMDAAVKKALAGQSLDQLEGEL